MTPNTLRAQYLENKKIKYAIYEQSIIIYYYVVCSEVVRSAILATA